MNLFRARRNNFWHIEAEGSTRHAICGYQLPEKARESEIEQTTDEKLDIRHWQYVCVDCGRGGKLTAAQKDEKYQVMVAAGRSNSVARLQQRSCPRCGYLLTSRLWNVTDKATGLKTLTPLLVCSNENCKRKFKLRDVADKDEATA